MTDDTKRPEEAQSENERRAWAKVEEIAKELTNLRRELETTRNERDEARRDVDMYANAWKRELGGRLIPKTYLIDALVLTTQRRLSRLTFEQLREADVKRLPLFKDKQGRYCHVASRQIVPGLVGSDWSLSQWSNALAGEVGEVCNLVKKIERGDFPLEEARLELGREMADVVIYNDLLGHRAGIDLGDAVREKFNKKSDDVGCGIHL